MVMYEIGPLQGFNANGFRVEQQAVQKSASEEVSQDESIVVYKVALTLPKKEDDQIPSENT